MDARRQNSTAGRTGRQAGQVRRQGRPCVRQASQPSTFDHRPNCIPGVLAFTHFQRHSGSFMFMVAHLRDLNPKSKELPTEVDHSHRIPERVALAGVRHGEYNRVDQHKEQRSIGEPGAVHQVPHGLPPPRHLVPPVSVHVLAAEGVPPTVQAQAGSTCVVGPRACACGGWCTTCGIGYRRAVHVPPVCAQAGLTERAAPQCRLVSAGCHLVALHPCAWCKQ